MNSFFLRIIASHTCCSLRLSTKATASLQSGGLRRHLLPDAKVLCF